MRVDGALPRALATLFAVAGAIHAPALPRRRGVLLPKRAANAGSGQNAVVIMSGTAERLVLHPLLNFVIKANTQQGMQVDFFFSLVDTCKADVVSFSADKGETKWIKVENTSDYGIDPTLQPYLGDTCDTQALIAAVCRWAHAAGSVVCDGNLERDISLTLPSDHVHENIMTYYNPILLKTGQKVLRRWRSLEALWKKAKAAAEAHGFQYETVLVVRDDNYWSAPYNLYSQDIVDNPATLYSIPCMESHGVNDKVLHMGHAATDAVLTAYEQWVRGNETVLQGTRNAEEIVLELARKAGVKMMIRGLPMTTAVFTVAGFPCFRKQKFNLLQGYHQCYGDASDTDQQTRLFKAYNCDDLKPAFFKTLSSPDMGRLEASVVAAAGQDRKPIIMTVTNLAKIDLVKNMLQSLSAVGEQAGRLVVGTEDGVCRALSRLDVSCVDLVRPTPDDQVRNASSIFFDNMVVKHAVLTFLAFHNLAEGIMFTDPDFVYLKPPLAEIRSRIGKDDVIFSTNNALIENAESCSDVLDRYFHGGLPNLFVGETQKHVDLSTGLMYLQANPTIADLMLRAWMIMEENKHVHYEQWALIEALKASPWVSVGTLPCDRFVHGNVFWGHHNLLKMDDVFAVRANWMSAESKRVCLKDANLWVGERSGPTWWQDSQNEANSNPGAFNAQGQSHYCGQVTRELALAKRAP